MDLKLRKRILNTLPSFNLGTEAAMATVNSKDAFGLLSGGNVALFDQTANLKLENSMLKSGQFTTTKDGKLEAKVSAQGGKTGAFLKNNVGNIANAAMSAINFASTIGGLSKNTMSSDEMIGSGGTTQESANGIGYTQQRVDDAGILKQIDATASAATMTGALSGAALGGSIGTIFGPLGTGIGTLAGGLLGGVAGLIGGKEAKEEAERLKRIAINRTNAANALNREQAYTIGLRNEFNRENRTDESQSLFHAENGVEGAVNPRTGATYKKHVVNTAYGKAYGPQNAWVSDGEVIGNKNDGYLYKVQGGKNDTARAYLEPGDSVYSKKVINPETGNPVADDAPVYAAMGMLDRLDMNLNVGRMMKYAGRRKGNVLPGYIGGTNNIWNTVKNIGSSLDWENIIPTATAFASAALRDAQAEGGLRAPKSYVANPYENAALDELNKLHSDYYPVWAQNRELEGRGKSSIAQSGGLSAGQKMLGYMGLANKTQQNNAAALFEHQGRENALRAQAANAALQAGNQSATRQQQAYQWDEDMLAKAHSARLNMWETSAYDRQNALTQFFKNAWEKNQFDRTMNLYETDQKMSEADREFYRNQFIKNNKPAAPTAPTLADKAASTVTAAGAASIHPSQVAPTSAVPTIKVQAPQPAVKPTTKRGKKAAAGVKKPVAKGKSATSSTETSSVTAKPVATSYTPYAFGNPAIQERFPNASAEAKLARPNKEKAGRPAPTSNAEALSRLWEKMKLGKREYERRYGKGS